MVKFEEIQQAKEVLGLREAATLKEISKVYQEKANCYHPDKGGSEEMMKKINWAYKLLMDYCGRYRYTFTEEDWKRTYPVEAHLEWCLKNWPF